MLSFVFHVFCIFFLFLKVLFETCLSPDTGQLCLLVAGIHHFIKKAIFQFIRVFKNFQFNQEFAVQFQLIELYDLSFAGRLIRTRQTLI